MAGICTLLSFPHQWNTLSPALRAKPWQTREGSGLTLYLFAFILAPFPRSSFLQTSIIRHFGHALSFETAAHVSPIFQVSKGNGIPHVLSFCAWSLQCHFFAARHRKVVPLPHTASCSCVPWRTSLGEPRACSRLRLLDEPSICSEDDCAIEPCSQLCCRSGEEFSRSLCRN
jgi:hypothetical protein